MKKQHPVQQYFEACERIKEAFISKYYIYETLDRESIDDFWVGDDIGGVICINDYFHNLKDMVDALILDCPREKFFEWYDYSLENYEKKDAIHYNLKSFMALKFTSDVDEIMKDLA